MAIDRRSLLLGCCAGALAAGAPAWAVPLAVCYAAARRAADGSYSAAIFTADGHDVRAVALPGRGHDITVCPMTRRCVVFARRPGNFAIAFSADRGHPPVTFTTPPDRHFYGHGIFSRDGRLLYATENDFDGERGIIGIYDVRARFKRLGEFPSYGLGPHDLAFLRRQPVLVIANGGLREHPDFGGGRRVLNAGAIETSLAYVNVDTGDLLERHVLGAPGTHSLRHLDVGSDDTVVVGAQIEGADHRKAGLVFAHQRQKALTAVSLPHDLMGRLAGYVSSVAVDASGEMAAITSSRGNLTAMIEIGTGRVVRIATCPDTSGVCSTSIPRTFLTTSGGGDLVSVSASEAPVQAMATPWLWDNHATIVASL
jgi:hypothetical protein